MTVRPTCENCGEPRVGAFRYCRSCGHDFEPGKDAVEFVVGGVPAAASNQTAAPRPAPAPAPAWPPQPAWPPRPAWPPPGTAEALPTPPPVASRPTFTLPTREQRPLPASRGSASAGPAPAAWPARAGAPIQATAATSASGARPRAERQRRRPWEVIPVTIGGVPRRRFIVVGVELVLLLVVVAALSYRPPTSSTPTGSGAGLGVAAQELQTVFELDRNGGFVFLDERGGGGTPRLRGTSAAGRLDLHGDPANLERIRLSVHAGEVQLVKLLALQVVPDLAADVESVLEEAPEGSPEMLEGETAIVTITLNPAPNDDVDMLIQSLGG